MSIYGNVSTATATVGANTNAVSIAGLDLTIVSPGMTINFGARDRKTGDAYVIASVAPTGTSGGTLTLVGTVAAAYTNAPFLIDTTGYLGTDSSYAATVSLKLLDTLNKLFGPATNLFAGSRQLVFDKVASAAMARIAFAIAGRTWADLAHRSFTFTPAGGQTTSVETLAVRAFSDGATPTDALLFDLTNGTGDLRKGSATMVAGSTVDLGSAPMGKVAITGAATINAFGAGRHLDRLVRFVDGGGTLVHSAALDLPGGVNVAVQAGDRLHATSDGSGNWRVHAYQRGDGTPLVLPASTQRAGFRNRLINSNFSVNQRGVPFASTTYAAGAYIIDRWKAGPGGVTLSLTNIGNGDALATITAGSICQIIEGRLYLPETGNYVLSWQGTAVGRVHQGSAGAFAASPVVLSLNGGLNTTVEFGTGTLLLPQLEPGLVATPFERRDDEVQRCQRYYQRGTASILGSAYAVGAVVSSSIRFSVEMAFQPTILYTPAYERSVGTKTIDAFSTDSFRIYFLASSADTNAESTGGWTARAEL